MKDIDRSKSKMMALAMVAGLALGGCANMGSGSGDEPMPQAGDEQSALSQVDRNADDRVSQDEFQSFAEENDVFGRWDEDRDGTLAEDEFSDIGFARTIGDYDAWDEDGDGAIDSDEMYSSVFNAYDEDRDGYWDTSEWNDAGDSGLFDV